MIEVYGFSGKLGVGKNYVAEKIFMKYLATKNTVVLCFADHFKVDVVSKDKVPFDKVFVKKDEHTRKLLQLRGTEEGRNIYGADIWIRTLDTWIELLSSRGVERFIICDVRFVNEVEYIKSKGGKVIRINAIQRNIDAIERESNGNQEMFRSIQTHISETTLDNYTDFDLVLNNDYGKDIEKDISDFFNKNE